MISYIGVTPTLDHTYIDVNLSMQPRAMTYARHGVITDGDTTLQRFRICSYIYTLWWILRKIKGNKNNVDNIFSTTTMHKA